jgi:hypothetical protein
VRIFTPLTGSEIKEILLRKIENQMDADMRFREHLTYPTIKWRWTLEIDTYPNDPGEFAISTQGVVSNPGQAPFADKRGEVSAPKTPSSMVMEGIEDVRAGVAGAPEDSKAPDDVREQSGMPLTQQSHVKVGGATMIFDKLAETRGATGRGRGGAK